jgi:DNA-binding CsgD family transcriptional regulator
MPSRVGGTQPIGRNDELARIRAFLEHSRPLPRVFLLEGEAGIGKTTLWQAGLELADGASFRVLTAQAASSEGEFAFAVVADLLEDDVSDLLPELPRPQRHALEIALLLEDPGSAPPDPRTIATALLGALRLLARKRRLLLAIDDVQWIDAASRRALEFALRRLGDEPIAFLLTRRAEPAEPPPLGLGRAITADALTRLHVGPLSLGALNELLRIHLGFTCPRPTLRRLADESGGNPFFALEFARALQRRGVRVEPGEPLPVPTTLYELVADRLTALPARTREALLVAALAFKPTVELVASALDGGAWERILPAVDADAIRVEGGSIGFTHPLVAAALQASVDDYRRRHAHLLLADVVAAPEERAWHLALATEAPDAEIARELEVGAEAAAARGAPATAASLLEHAWRLTPSAAGAANERRVAAARMHFRAGDARRAEELLEQALREAPSGVVRAHVLHELATVERETRGVRQGTDRYYEALRETTDAPALRALIQRELASILRFTGDLDTAREHAATAVALAREAGHRRTLAEALAFAALLQFNAGEPGSFALADQAIAVAEADPEPAYEPRRVLGHQLMWSGRFADARPVLEELQREFSARGDVSEIDVLWYLAQLELRAGNWIRASEHTDALRALVLQSGREDEERTALWPTALVAAHRGDLDAATAMSEHGLALAQASGARTGVVIHRGVLGLVELLRGDPRKAGTHFVAAHDNFSALGIREPAMLFVMSGLPDAIEALLMLGAQAQARALLEPWEEHARSLDRPWPLSVALRCRGLVLAAENDLASALGAVEESLAQHERAEDPFQLARTLLAAGALQRRAKQRRAARESLEGARALFAELGSPVWADRAGIELGRIGGRRPSGGRLTVSERRLAELVAEGRSNKEIAAALFVTPKTVGTMLSRIYAKLDVHSRTELAHVLAERGASKV